MSENYITIQEGMFNGVSYRIRDAEVVEKEDGHFIKFDYDAKGLDDEKAPEFEKMLGELITKALEEAVNADNNKEG